MPAIFGSDGQGSAPDRLVTLDEIRALLAGARERMAGRSYQVDQWVYSDPIGEKAAADRRLAAMGIMGRAAVVQQDMVEVLEGPEQPWSRRELLLTDGDVRYRSTVLADDGNSAAHARVLETIICDGRRVWTILPIREGDAPEAHWRRMTRAELGLQEMADPSWLLRGYDLSLGGDARAGHRAEYGDRLCYELVAVPVQRSELVPADDPCDRIDLLVDAQTGILLRLARVIGDRDYQIREWADFQPDARYGEDTFVYVPEDPSRVVEDTGRAFGDGLVASLLKLGRPKH